MIVKMKKTTILCLLDDRRDTLEKLASLGVLHVDAGELKDSDDRKSLEDLHSETIKAEIILSGIDKYKEGDNEFLDLTGEELVFKTLKINEEKSELDKKLEKLASERALLLPWGDFSPELLNGLKEDGMNIYLCSSPNASFKLPKHGSLEEKASIIEDVLADKTGVNTNNILIKIVQADKSNIWFAVVSSEDIDESLLPIDNVPVASLNDTEKMIEKTKSDIKQAQIDFSKIALYADRINGFLLGLEEKVDFTAARDGMGEADSIVYIEGFIPIPDIDNLKKTAEENGWGLMLRDPKPEETPPTLIKTPKILEMSKPIFDFIGISPGYREWDVSGCFLFFFTIFFGIIVGDAGYGAIFLILSLLARIKFRNNEKLKLPIRLFLLLSCSTIVWGLLNGTIFAIPSVHLPRWMRGIKWFTDPEVKDQHIQQLCFFIAAVHLSLGHLWKAILYINSRKALGEIAWAMLLWGNYFTALNLIVYPDSAWPTTLLGSLYIPGVILVALFSINWKAVSGLFDFFFGMIGTFVDLLSYIRLFAVGLSSYYIAVSFNDMGLMILKGVESKMMIAILMVPAVLIIFGGHLLNIVLALLAVLVHGIRLNTLEFSNHMALQWLGHVYKPFKSKNSENSSQKSDVGIQEK